MKFDVNSDEGLLVAETTKGNEDAFACLYNRYYDRIYAFTLGFIKSPLISQDVSQEVFIKLWNERSRLDAVRSFQSYLFTIARNHTLNYLRSIANSKAALGEVLYHFPKNEHSTDHAIEMKEYFVQIEKVLSTLTPTSRKIFLLCREERRSYEEVADELGISKNAVKKHMVKTMKAFRYHLKDYLTVLECLTLTGYLLYSRIF